MSELEELAGVSRWFPHFRLRSLTAGLTALQVLFFLVSLALGTQDWNPATCSLYELGGLFAADVELRYQLQRLVMPALLHANLLHLVVNVMFQLQVGFALERYFGGFRFMLIFVLSEILGNLYASWFDRYSVIVGASTGLFGLLGSQAAIFAYNWKEEDSRRLERLAVYGVSVFITFAMSSLWPHCTRIGHLSSFIYGVMLGFLLLRLHSKAWKWWALRLLAAAGIAGATFWVLRQMLHNRQFYDCAFLQYLDSNGEVRTAGNRCELMCSDY
jgi:rhomboid protease GluP